MAFPPRGLKNNALGRNAFQAGKLIWSVYKALFSLKTSNSIKISFEDKSNKFMKFIIVLKLEAKIMRRIFLIVLFAVIAPAASAMMKLGSPAPSFTINAALAGKEFSFNLSESLKKDR